VVVVIIIIIIIIIILSHSSKPLPANLAHCGRGRVVNLFLAPF
jgi:hypothetical protein